MSEQEQYGKILTELIQKQMVILGPNIALDKARKVSGLQISEDGAVLNIEGNVNMIFKSLVNEYMGLSSQVTQMTLGHLFEKYPQIKSL